MESMCVHAVHACQGNCRVRPKNKVRVHLRVKASPKCLETSQSSKTTSQGEEILIFTEQRESSTEIKSLNDSSERNTQCAQKRIGPRKSRWDYLKPQTYSLPVSTSFPARIRRAFLPRTLNPKP